MIYINPFEFLEIESSQQPIVDAAVAQKLAVIKQSEKGFLIYQDHQVDEVLLLQIANELVQPERSAFHKFIQTHPLLLAFLTNADPLFFEQYEASLLYQNKKFKAFVAPYFLEAFNAYLPLAFDQNRKIIIRQMVDCPLLPSGAPGKTGFRALRMQIEKELAIIQSSYQQLKWGRTQFEAKPHQLCNAATSYLRPRLLNLLPQHFDDLRGKIASLWADLARLIFERFPADRRYFYQLIQAAHQLEVRPAVRTRLQEDLQFLAAGLAGRRAQYLEASEDRFEKQLQWIRNVEQGLIGKALSAEQMTVLLDENLLAEELVLYQSNPLRLQQLTDEMSKLALSLWRRFEQLPLFEKVVELTFLISPIYNNSTSKKTSLTSKHFELLRFLLPLLKTRLRKKLKVGFDEANTNSWVRLLKNLFEPKLIQQLQHHSNIPARRHLFDQLLPVMHLLRRSSPVGILDLLDQLEPVIRKDATLRRMTDALSDRIELEFEKSARLKVTRKPKWQKAPQRDPLDRLTIWQKTGDQLLLLRAFLFNDETTGPHRVIYLVSLFVLTGTLGLASYSITKSLNTTYVVEEHPSHLRFSDARYKEPKFVRDRSLYVGNQLKNGAKPFSRCFGEGTYVFGSGNVLHLKNTLPEDAVVCLYDPSSKAIVRHAYLRSGAALSFWHLPKGSYTIKVYAGKDWNPIKPNFCGLHGAFDTNPHYLKRSKKEGPLEFDTNNTYRLHLGADAEMDNGFKTFSISANSFFKAKK